MPDFDFSRRAPLRTEHSSAAQRRLRVALAALVAVLLAGTIGYFVLGFGALDALYQTVTTVTTVGFGEVEPFSATAKVFTMVLILVGVGATLYALGAFIELLVEGRISELFGRRRMDRRISALQGHVVVCGWGRVGRALARNLGTDGPRVVVVDSDPERLEAVPHLHVLGDATDDGVLQAAGIERAGTLVAALASDADNLFVTLSGRALQPELFIVARARDESSVEKLTRAGADRVVNPQEIGGARMAAFVRQPHVAEFMDVVMHEAALDYRLAEVPVAASSPLAGCTLADAAIRERTGALVLALRHPDGRFETNPTATTSLEAGRVLIAMGTPDQLDDLRAAARP